MWWYSQNNQTSGPFPEEQLKDRLRSGELDGEQFACSEGSSAGPAVGRLTLRVLLALLLGIGLAAAARAQTYTFTHLAGNVGDAGIEDGTGSAARFYFPRGVAVDGSGNVYVADTYNQTIRKITPAGVVTTLAGTAGSVGSADGTGSAARFSYPSGVAVDGSGNVYVADTNTIRKITPTGVVTTLAGTAGASGSADGTGSAARFASPVGVAVDGSGNVYVADFYNNTIRKITPAGVVTTLAGTAGTSGSTDGTGSAARFRIPYGVAVDSSGNVYVADTYNQTIRKITPAGVVTTLAGTAGSWGSVDGTGSAARFASPVGVAVDGSGNVYVADSGNHTIRKITPAGVVTTLAGTAGSVGSADGTGSAAQFNFPRGVAVDGSGNVYVADTNTIRKITPAGVVTTLAGTAGTSGSADGTGSAARFYSPRGVAVDGSGNVYVADTFNSTIRKITPAGVVTTLAGTAGSVGSADGTGSAARFDDPSGVAVDGSGNVYVADTWNHTVRKITPAGVVTTLAGTAYSYGSADGTGSAARFCFPRGVAVDGSGNVYVADTNNGTIRKITPAGVVTTLAGTALSGGSADGTGSAARFYSPSGVAVDSSGNVYVADAGNSTIRKITPAGVVTTLAGTAGSVGSADGTGSAARFYSPSGVAVDGSGNVYVADTNTIRKITPTGVVTTLAGTAGTSGSTDGTGSAARFSSPVGVAVDGSGNVYVADTSNNAIRKGVPAIPDVATIDAASGPFGVTRQLGTSPFTATSWQWSLIRRPSSSSAQLSSSSIPNPTFTPDVVDLFVFRLIASNSSGTSITFVSLVATGPTISAVTPASGTLAGGTAVTITGTNFNFGASVTIGGTAATSVIVVSSTQITATTPAHAAGAVNVVVTNADAQSATLASGFTYVTAAPPTAPTATFTASPATITAGQTTTLSWATTNATSVSIDNGLGAQPTSGSGTVAPTATTTYTLTATGAGGTTTKQVTVTVTPATPPPSITFTATPTSITAGQSSTLSWSVVNATSVFLDNGVGLQTASGEVAVAPASTTVYTLVAVGPGGTSVASVTVTVSPGSSRRRAVVAH
jgi:IPT/TIG domain/NHL repeat/GYF domain 2